MRRIAIVGALAVAIVIVRSRSPQLHERLMASCEKTFERMPDTFPPKKMMLGIDEIRATTSRTEQALRARLEDAVEPKANEAVTRALAARVGASAGAVPATW